jgi:aerobic-type carbon monoxide dehydrogenase small subunit (CoxS/CutS family)
MPDVAKPGTAQTADGAQLPQSTSPVAATFRQAGWFCGYATPGCTVAT